MKLRAFPLSMVTGSVLVAVAAMRLAPSTAAAATTASLAVAIALIAVAVRSTLTAHGRRSGLGYDALHAGAQVADIVSHAGSALVELSYRSRQVVFLDDAGLPTTAVTSGPGSVKVIAGAGRHNWRRWAQLRRDRRALTIIERGVQTADGRVVSECLLATEDGGRQVSAEMAASTAFPTGLPD